MIPQTYVEHFGTTLGTVLLAATIVAIVASASRC